MPIAIHVSIGLVLAFVISKICELLDLRKDKGCELRDQLGDCISLCNLCFIRHTIITYQRGVYAIHHV